MASTSLGAIGQWWRRWVRASTNRKIFGALVIVSSATIGVKLASMIKDLIAAATFGTGRDLDAYFIAFALPYFFSSLIAGAIGSAFIPAYIEVETKGGAKEAQRLFSGVLVISLALLSAATVILAAVGPSILPFLATGFDDDALALCRRLFYLMLPTVLISGMATIWINVLTARERFALASVSEIAIPLCSAVALIVGGHSWGIYALIAGLIVGTAVQLSLVGWQLLKHGMSIRPAWFGASPALRQVIGQFLPMLAATVVISTAPVVDNAMAGTLSEGSVTALTFGSKIVSPLLGVSAIGLGTAVMPYFSQMVAAANWTGIRRTLFVYTRLILLISLPVTLLLVVFSEPLIRLLFQRGAFDAGSTHVVANVNAMYALQIPAYALTILFVRLIAAMRANQILMYGSIIAAVSNVVFDYVLKEAMGVEGIALATTIIHSVTLIFLGAMLYRLLRERATA